MIVDPYTCARCGGLLDNPDGPRVCGPCKTAHQQVREALKHPATFTPEGFTLNWVPFLPRKKP